MGGYLVAFFSYSITTDKSYKIPRLFIMWQRLAGFVVSNPIFP